MMPLISFVVGSVLKVFAQGIGKWIEMKKARDLLLANAPIEKIKALQSGEDKLSPGGKATRRILAFTLIGTWCFILVYHVVFKPELLYSILIPKTPGIAFSWIFGAVDSTAVTISAGALLWSFFDVVMLVSGFYFTKIEKGG